MKKILFVVSVIWALASCTQVADKKRSLTLPEALPESVGMSSERLARIDSMFVNAVSEGKVPGAVALVARNGKIVYHKAFGLANNESGRELNRDDIFRIASQTKAITATAVMMLWEEGKFKLDEPISNFIPEFKNPQVLQTFDKRDTSFTTIPASGQITIRQLLNHTSGLGYGAIDQDERFRMIYSKAGIIDLATTENISIGENIKNLAKLPLHHNPGEKLTYSEGLDVLGYFVEIISGMPLDVFLKTRLFEPLGMLDTWFYLPDAQVHRLVTVQKPEKDKWVKYPVTFYDPEYPVKGARRYFAGGAGLSSTAKDYARFLQMYLNGGELNGTRFLSRTTIQTIMANQIGNLWGEDSDQYYGLAFGVVNQKGQSDGGKGSAGTFLWGGYFNTLYWADPSEQIIGILMKQTQGGTADDTEWKFRILVGQAVAD